MTDLATSPPPRPALRSSTFESGWVAVTRNGKNQGLLMMRVYTDDTASLFHRLHTRPIATLAAISLDPPPPWQEGVTIRVIGVNKANGRREEWSISAAEAARAVGKKGCQSCGGKKR